MSDVVNIITFKSCGSLKVSDVFEAIKDETLGVGSISFRTILPPPHISCGSKWCRENWGTELEAYGMDEMSINPYGDGIWFQTKDTAPHPVIHEIATRFPEMEIQHEWAADVNHRGERIYFAGRLVEENLHSEDVKEFAARILEIELEDMEEPDDKNNGFIKRLFEVGYVYAGDFINEDILREWLEDV